MEKGNIINQMAQYDFSTPINITMIFEDDGMEGSNNNNSLKDQTQNKISSPQKSQILQDATQSKSQSITNSKNLLPNREQMKENRIYEPYVSNAQDKIQSDNNFTLSNEITNMFSSDEQNSSDAIERPQQITHHRIKENEELPSSVQCMIDTVTEHLIVIMRYYYDSHGNAQSIDSVKQFNTLKCHFFDLSYSTVVSLILPQEKNDKLAKKIIDQTVFNANKSCHWKCEPRHVKPFYNQMIEWAKIKRTRIKSLDVRCSDAPSSALKERLTAPPPRVNIPNNASAITQNANQPNVISNSGNNICLFSPGAPGQEISLNIIPDTSSGYTPPTRHTRKPTKKNLRNNKSPDCQNTPTQVQNDGRVNYIPQKCYSTNSIVHYEPLPSQAPPPYIEPHNMIVSNNNSPYFNPTMQNYQLPRTNFVCSSSQQQLQYNSEINGQNFSPVITNVTSWNPVAFPANGKCCICGKPTISRCSKCNRYSYCSALCQQLDAGVHKTTCR